MFEDGPVDAALAATGIDGQRRGETLDIPEFAALANALETRMPELPEVETVRRTLQPGGRREDRGGVDSGKGLHMQRKPPRKKLRGLVGARITQIRRHGKYLLVDTDTPDSLLVHLGMTGRFLIVREATPRAKHTHLVLWLDDGRELRFVDARRFGQIDVVARDREAKHPGLAVLGPDPLVHGIDGALLTRARAAQEDDAQGVRARSERARRRRQHLRERGAVAAQLRPTKRAHKLTAAPRARLAEAILEVLHNALDNGGTSSARFRRCRRNRRRERGLPVGLWSRG